MEETGMTLGETLTSCFTFIIELTYLFSLILPLSFLSPHQPLIYQHLSLPFLSLFATLSHLLVGHSSHHHLFFFFFAIPQSCLSLLLQCLSKLPYWPSLSLKWPSRRLNLVCWCVMNISDTRGDLHLCGSASSFLHFAATCRIHRSNSHICSGSLQQAHAPTYSHIHTHTHTHKGTQMTISSLDSASASPAND